MGAHAGNEPLDNCLSFPIFLGSKKSFGFDVRSFVSRLLFFFLRFFLHSVHRSFFAFPPFIVHVLNGSEEDRLLVLRLQFVHNCLFDSGGQGGSGGGEQQKGERGYGLEFVRCARMVLDITYLKNKGRER